MKIIIIGGGLAGLNCAVELLDRGADVTVLEGKSAQLADLQRVVNLKFL